MLVFEDLGPQSAAAIAQDNNKFRSCFRFCRSTAITSSVSLSSPPSATPAALLRRLQLHQLVPQHLLPVQWHPRLLLHQLVRLQPWRPPQRHRGPQQGLPPGALGRTSPPTACIFTLSASHRPHLPLSPLQILSRIPITILPLTCQCNVYPLHTNLPPVFQGCFELVTSFIETNMAIIAGVTFGIAFSQVQKKCWSSRVRVSQGVPWDS